MTSETRTWAHAREVLHKVLAENGPGAMFILDAALRQAADEALERARFEARRMADTISATPRVTPFQALIDFAARLEAMKSPAAAPAAEACRVECASHMPCALPKNHVGPHRDYSPEWTVTPPSEPVAPAGSDFLTETELQAAEERCRAADRLAGLFGGDTRSEFGRMVAEIRFRRAALADGGESPR